MNVKLLLSTLALGVCASAHADTITVTDVLYSGPVAIPAIVAIGDTAGVDMHDVMTMNATAGNADYRNITLDGLAPTADRRAAHALKFTAENRRYADATLNVKGLADYAAYCDGQRVNGKVSLHPGTHDFVIRYVSDPAKSDSLSITLSAEADGLVTLRTDGQRMFTLDDVLYGTRISGAEVSPSGAWALVRYADTGLDGTARYYHKLFDVKSGRAVATLREFPSWMPNADKYYVERSDYEHGRHIVTVDPATGTETILAEKLPQGGFTISPTADYLLFSLVKEGPKEDAGVYQVIHPEDRQPGWRDRVYPAIYRLDGTATMLPLTGGYLQTYPADISPDGQKVLLMVSEHRLTQRPTTLATIIQLDINTMETDTIVSRDGFVGVLQYSPDGKQVLVSGTPEAFGRIGCQLPDSVIPNMTEQELFVVTIADGTVTPITRDFDPSIQSAQWSKHDGKIYARVEDRDKYSIYCYDFKGGKWMPLAPEENSIKGLALADGAPIMAWWGQSDSNPDRLYFMDTKRGQSRLIDEPSASRLADVKLGEMHEWTFVSERGDTIDCRFYLPDNFDPEAKYPMIVNYYGGCSPTTRLFDSRYPHHVYSSLGYVVLVVQPSGATGYGQEFASRHVNTAGRGVADDIIEATTRFCDEHPYVNADKIGCIGASYGGFMTQYLQTVTDIFAAAISHAGISDHTSYWGEGYWGYSYSEVSMAENYPWTNIDLYVKQSPLYNADKVNTPILFLHGDADMNVPVGESIQMYTALKLLGKDAALVQVKDQDHHILQYDKRKRWQDTIFAWFAKYLQDDPTWWDALYPPKKL